jgi:diguanylate cyclase (GGDEF)-like protein
MNDTNKFSINSKNLRYKLRIAFFLTLILPLLICMYLIFNYIAPNGVGIGVLTLITLSVIIGISGFLIIRDVILRVVNISSDVKLIVAGDMNRTIRQQQKDEVGEKDEVEELVDDVGMLNQQIREKAELLKNYSEKIEKLEIKDTLTGLYNERFIHSRLEEELRRALAYHRPCAFVLFRIDDFRRLYDNFGIRFAETVLKKVAFLIKDSVSEIDYVSRFGDTEFAVLLPERNKRKAIDIAENIKGKIEFSFSEETPDKRITLSGTVSENPLDGIVAEELITKARHLMDGLSDSSINKILS